MIYYSVLFEDKHVHLQITLKRDLKIGIVKLTWWKTLSKLGNSNSQFEIDFLHKYTWRHMLSWTWLHFNWGCYRVEMMVSLLHKSWKIYQSLTLFIWVDNIKFNHVSSGRRMRCLISFCIQLNFFLHHRGGWPEKFFARLALMR